MNKTSIQIITLGCAKNLVDSEKMLAQLPADRFEVLTGDNQTADVVIINTCGFINDAKEESIDTILRVVEARKNGSPRQVIVTGCLSERYKEELRKEIPEVDAWFGARDPAELFRHLQSVYVAGNPGRLLTTPSHYAYLKISEGCNRTCSFCAIPMIKGSYRSHPITLLEEESRRLADKGVRELLLVAQDLSCYGLDLDKKPRLADLLDRLLCIEGIEWIRLHYAYPHNFPDRVTEMMASEPRICNYLDIPLQHINDNVLQSMRRGHDKKGTVRFLEKLRKKIPDIALRTTLMVGYPSETEEAFGELLEFVETMRFERLGVFTYSAEEGTPAYPLGDPIPERVKAERAEAVMDLQAGISAEKNRSMVGRSLKAVIDSHDRDRYIARSQYDSPEVDNELVLTGKPGIPPGTFVNACITDAAEFDLYGSIASPDNP